MGSEDGLVEIHPRELQFLFEVKKQSSCSVHLVNKTDEQVAFKVKTTSPKRYCVRPNTGVILPRATCDFIVTMQAQKTAPPDLQIKDKFLVQTTVVPSGASVEGIVPDFFSKESGRYIEENKLRVILVTATQPEVDNGVPNAETAVEVPVAKETLNIVNEVPNVVNEVPHPLKASFPPLRETPAILKTSVALKESPPPLKDTSAPKEVAILSDGLASAENLHLSHVTEDVQNLKSKLNNLEVKLEEAENLIIKLREETRTTIKERDKLQHEMVFLKRKGTSPSQAGFPLLFVVYMAILGASLGYLLHL